MGLKARIKWHFKPVDYFEAPYSHDFDGVPLEINDGKIIAELDLDRYEKAPGIRESLTDYIEGLFEGVMLQSHKDFHIGAGAVEKDRPEGGKDIIVTVKPTRIAIAAGSVDIRMADAQGNVVADTRQDRIAAKRKDAELIASKRGLDKTLDAMIKSYLNAVKDPDDEFIHLYEIKEALKDLFGDKKTATQTIGMNPEKWSRLGNLANNEPLNQGRHRGKKGSELRDATAQELEEARSIAREMIVPYARQVVPQSEKNNGFIH